MCLNVTLTCRKEWWCFLFIYNFMFFRDSNKIFIRKVGFRFYVVVLILVNLGKP